MPYFIIAFVIIFFPDFYIWYSFIRGGGQAVWSILYWLPSVVLIASMAFGLTGHNQTQMMNLFFAILLCMVIPKTLFAVISLVGKTVELILPQAATIGNIAGVAIAVTAFGAAVYGMTEGWKRIVVRNIEITSDELPASFDGYTIVQLSDFHIGTYASSPETVKEIIAKVNELHPDAILFTGDLVNDSPEELDPFMDMLSRLEAKDGIFSILGNHDYCEYRRYDTQDGAEKNLAELKRREQLLGWQLLLNEHRIISRGTDSIAIIGVENDGTPPFPSRADLPKATSGLSPESYKILLSHDPTHWHRAVLPQTNIQLTLSGHTHAMQLRIGNFSPSQWAYPEWGGRYEDNGRVLHVSTGTGSNVRFRFGAWPEIDAIRLHSNTER